MPLDHVVRTIRHRAADRLAPSRDIVGVEPSRGLATIALQLLARPSPGRQGGRSRSRTRRPGRSSAGRAPGSVGPARPAGAPAPGRAPSRCTRGGSSRRRKPPGHRRRRRPGEGGFPGRRRSCAGDVAAHVPRPKLRAHGRMRAAKLTTTGHRRPVATIDAERGHAGIGTRAPGPRPIVGASRKLPVSTPGRSRPPDRARPRMAAVSGLPARPFLVGGIALADAEEPPGGRGIVGVRTGQQDRPGRHAGLPDDPLPGPGRERLVDHHQVEGDEDRRPFPVIEGEGRRVQVIVDSSPATFDVVTPAGRARLPKRESGTSTRHSCLEHVPSPRAWAGRTSAPSRRINRDTLSLVHPIELPSLSSRSHTRAPPFPAAGALRKAIRPVLVRAKRDWLRSRRDWLRSARPNWLRLARLASFGAARLASFGALR